MDAGSAAGMTGSLLWVVIGIRFPVKSTIPGFNHSAFYEFRAASGDQLGEGIVRQRLDRGKVAVGDPFWAFELADVVIDMT